MDNTNDFDKFYDPDFPYDAFGCSESKYNFDLNYKCKHCDQVFWLGTLKFAVFLYGIFFLVGKKSRYIGIVCPKCINTILIECNDRFFDGIKKILSSPCFYFSKNNAIQIDLSYHSSANYFIKNNPAVMDFDVLRVDIDYPNEPGVDYSKEGYLCSYIPEWDSRIGWLFTVCWYKKNQISALVEIENKERLRIIPRYVAIPNIKDIEDYCFKYRLSEDYYWNEFDELLDEEEDFSQASDLMNILSTFRWVVTENDEFFYAIKNPFHGHEVPKTLDGYDIGSHLVKPKKRLNHDKMINEIRPYFKKEYVQDLLLKMHDGFISEYIQLVQTIDFSNASIWNLKEQYLKQIYDSIQSKYKRSQTIKQLSKIDRHKVEKIEKKYSAFKKIISENNQIDKIKMRLFRRTQYKNRDKLTFLLIGETGTGKELFARAINEASGKERPFVAFNVSSIHETMFASELFGHEKGAFTGATNKKRGLFEQANGGTIFIDEIGDLNLELQTYLLRVIEEREIRPIGSTQAKKVDVIIIFATNKNLHEEVEKGNFRLDLYMRIKRFEERIPSLRERKNDFPLLVKHFIEVWTKEYEKPQSIGVTDNCMKLLKGFEWPGNIRDLENVISATIENRADDNDTSDIDTYDLPQNILTSVDPEKPSAKPQKVRKGKPSDEELKRLKKEGWTQDQVADRFEVWRETVNRWYAKIKKKDEQ